MVWFLLHMLRLERRVQQDLQKSLLVRMSVWVSLAFWYLGVAGAALATRYSPEFGGVLAEVFPVEAVWLQAAGFLFLVGMSLQAWVLVGDQLIWNNGDLELLLASPADRDAVAVARIVKLAIRQVQAIVFLIGPFVIGAMLLSGPQVGLVVVTAAALAVIGVTTGYVIGTFIHARMPTATGRAVFVGLGQWLAIPFLVLPGVGAALLGLTQDRQAAQPPDSLVALFTAPHVESISRVLAGPIRGDLLACLGLACIAALWLTVALRLARGGLEANFQRVWTAVPATRSPAGGARPWRLQIAPNPVLAIARAEWLLMMRNPMVRSTLVGAGWLGGFILAGLAVARLFFPSLLTDGADGDGSAASGFLSGAIMWFYGGPLLISLAILGAVSANDALATAPVPAWLPRLVRIGLCCVPPTMLLAVLVPMAWASDEPSLAARLIWWVPFTAVAVNLFIGLCPPRVRPAGFDSKKTMTLLASKTAALGNMLALAPCVGLLVCLELGSSVGVGVCLALLIMVLAVRASSSPLLQSAKAMRR
jgi:hypothetical protein